MVLALEKKISSPSSSTVIRIVAGVQTEKNVEYFDENSKELEKGSHEYKESSSTQTSSSSSLLHKRKVHSYYVMNRPHKTTGSYLNAFWKRPERNQSALPQRIISAKFLKVKQLQNELAEAQQKITDLLEENRTLKNIHKRQDSALKKYESQDSYLPQLIRSHEEEIRLKNAHLDLETRFNKQRTELVAVKERHKHLLQISKDKHLFQREHLTKQIEEMKIQINELKNKIKLQSRRLDLEAKNYKHQLSMELSKQKTLQDQVKQLQETINQLQNTLKDKEKCIVNSKVNHLISNKPNLLVKPKLPLNPLKPLRMCSISEDEKLKQSNEKDIQKETEILGSRLAAPMVLESGLILNENTAIKEDKTNSRHNSNHPPLSTAASILFGRERRSENCFIEDNGGSSNTILSQQTNTEKKSDNNNNKLIIKENSLDSNLSDTRTKATYNDDVDEQQIRNYSQNSFELYEKTIEDEASSGSSGENSDNGELKSAADDTISWLQFHERIKRANDDMETKLDEFCDTFVSSGHDAVNSSSSTSWQSTFQVQVVSKTNRNNQKKTFANDTVDRAGALSQDKKSALLTALSEIDEEKKDTTPFHTIFEKMDKKTSIRLGKKP